LLYHHFIEPKNAGFEVLTAGVKRSSIFWATTPCTPMKTTDVSEEHVVNIFRSRKQIKQETRDYMLAT
jgi:hypothetical protein